MHSSFPFGKGAFPVGSGKEEGLGAAGTSGKPSSEWLLGHSRGEVAGGPHGARGVL